MGAAGLKKPGDITPHHLMVRNAQGQARPLASTIDTVEPGQLLPGASDQERLPSPFADFWHLSDAQHWGFVPA